VAGSEEVIEIRALSTGAEFAEAVDLQKRIWGFADIELLPVRLFVVANKVGGHSFGAYEGGRMIGFLLAIPGIKPGAQGYLHSHMLGVLPEYRDRGIGRLLKLRQREDALDRHIDLIEWTFDPLEIKNAFFNIERLGAMVRRYVENQYGTTSSPLHGGLPTDRCIAEWWVASERVKSVLAGGAPDRGKVEERIELPAQIAEIRRTDPKCAREIQKAVAAQFHRLVERGLAAIGFERTETAGVYLLGKPE
jgi:predicted GNAT superfamily acetyltransferase